MLGILDQLSPEQQEQLIDWIESFTAKEVLEKVAAPEPEGFGIRTHATSLRRFYDKWQASQKTEDLQSAFHQLEGTEDPMLSKGISSALTRQAFRTVTGPKRAQMTLDQATKWIITMEKQQLREKELELAKRRLDLEEKKAAWTAMIQSANCEFMCNEVEDTRISIFHPEPHPEPTPNPPPGGGTHNIQCGSTVPVSGTSRPADSAPFAPDACPNPRPFAVPTSEKIAHGDHIARLSLIKGPLSAKRTNHDGHLTCGGVGNSFDKGEGSSASPAEKTQPQNTPQCPVIIEENTPTRLNFPARENLSDVAQPLNPVREHAQSEIQNLNSKINEGSLPSTPPSEIVSPEDRITSSLSLGEGPLSAKRTNHDGDLACGGVGNSLDKGERLNPIQSSKTQPENTAEMPVFIEENTLTHSNSPNAKLSRTGGPEQASALAAIHPPTPLSNHSGECPDSGASTSSVVTPETQHQNTGETAISSPQNTLAHLTKNTEVNQNGDSSFSPLPKDFTDHSGILHPGQFLIQSLETKSKFPMIQS
jgi:hypothetical protein